MAKHHSSPDFSRLPNFPKRFQSKYLIGKRTTRLRKFTPKSFFHTLLELVSGTNKEGYLHALLKSFDFEGQKGKILPPRKGSLSKKRARISFKFFRDYFFKLINQFEPYRLTFQGLRIYAGDGFELSLPRTKQILKAGFRGRSTSRYRETYYPRMYLFHCYDVLSGVTKALKYSHLLDEITDAEEVIPTLEKKSLTIYDRLFLCTRLLHAHKKAGNYFLARCKNGGFSEVKSFFRSKKTIAQVTLAGVKVHLIKFPLKSEKEKIGVFATNLPIDWVNVETISHLYTLRNEVEVSFKDLIETLRIEQWHSKSLNGILQELYAAFFLVNFAKIQSVKNNENPIEVMKDDYKKPNFKLLLSFIIDLLPKIMKRIPWVLLSIPTLLNLSTESRKRHSRSYPRELKTPASPYNYNNTVSVYDS